MSAYWFSMGFGVGCIAAGVIFTVFGLINRVLAKRHNARIEAALKGLDELDINAP